MKFWGSLCVVLISALTAWAQPYPKPEVREGLVSFQGVRSESVFQGNEEALVESVLQAVNDSTSTQIAVLFVASCEDDINFAAAQTLSDWGIGQAGKDNGVLVLIALEDRKMAISTGYGLEASLTDYQCSRLIQEVLIPSFREKAYEAGLSEMARQIAQILSSQFDPEAYSSPRDDRKTIRLLFLLIAVIALIFYSARHGGGPGSGFGGRRGYWMGPAGGGMYRGGFGGGFGGGVGFGGGGFGGFGGGMGGGGGASGGW